MESAQQERNYKKTQKLTMNEKLTFGLGDFGANYSWTFIASFITIYMTDTAGIGAGIIGTLILISRVADGFTDLYMGKVVDNTKAKMGKAKPWVFWTAPILGILTFMLFNVPSSFGQTGKIVYVFLIYFLISALFYTANNVAYSSLTSFMTNDKKDRVSLGSIRFIFANVAVLSINTFTVLLVDAFGGGQQGWTFVAALYALLCAIPLMATGWFVKERNVAEKKNKEEKTAFLPIVKVLITNKYFILTFVLYLLWYLRQTENGIRVYYATYVLDNPDLMGVLSVAALLPMIIGLFFAPKFVGKFGIKKSVNAGLIVSVIAYVIMIFSSENVTFLVIGLIINAIGLVPLQGALTAIVADVGDLVYWKSGVPVQGSVFSLTSAGMKIGQGITSALVGWSLAIGGYVAGATMQTDGATIAMKTMMIYFPLATVILMFITVALLNYEKFIPKVKEDIENGYVGEARTKNL
ncbi:GPH family glycoside/pentoside/hexuronide:cation symporter [Virgibacillus natechei]|uniref:GPH family glycoside/pentoside/hexuronide:cation symporter n=1 Tax=Virgibacillus natechei TaxID=1216297 RepID=A0ABS4IEF3_9BACI|nr:glycoside-pentoside-hexuronide (GPH):cation symporter [Virgibacillus natechei]MBP1969318.1 GPH family glycoside/pentoside/hexuronide:cation symporter [Virgibacillus natechei]UZD12471.1 glycoside-pentoside-hexuronide (GPH):cation symporter [Virgibacillus natechei]